MSEAIASPQGLTELNQDQSRFEAFKQSAWTKLAIGGLVVASAVGIAGCGRNSDPTALAAKQEAPATTPPTTTETTTPPTTEALPCGPTWEMKGVNLNDKARWFEHGIPGIKAAAETKNEDTARVAIDEWLNGNSEHPGIKNDKDLTTAAYNTIMQKAGKEERVKPEELVDAAGCATPRARLALAEMKVTLSEATVRAVDKIDGDAYNTGRTENGITRNEAASPITGDSTAIEIVFQNNTHTESTTAKGDKCEDDSFYIMYRCGQFVFVKTGNDLKCIPPFDIGKTDHDPTGEVAHPQPGAGGSPEAGDTNPRHDSPVDGYSDPIDKPKDTDGDGIYDGDDDCITQPENFNGYQDGDGCPDVKPVPQTTSTSSTTPPTTGGPRPTEAPTPVTTKVPIPTGTKPPTKPTN